MASILLVGVKDELVRWLASRLSGVDVLSAASAASAEAELAKRSFGLMVVEESLPDAAMDVFIADLRRDLPPETTRILCILQRTVSQKRAGHLISELKVEQLLLEPLDREEVARQIASLLGVELRKASAAASEKTVAAVAKLWEKFREPTLERVTALQATLQALAGEGLDAEGRRSGEFEAHKLAGSLGTYGFPNGSRWAKEIELALRQLEPGAARASEPELAHHLLDQLVRLRAEILAGPSQGMPAGGAAPSLHLILATADEPLAAALRAEAALKGLRVEQAASIEALRQRLHQVAAQAVLLDLDLPSSGGKGNGKPAAAGGLHLLTELTTRIPPLPTLVLVQDDAFTERLEIVRLGAEGAVQKSQPPAQMIEWVSFLLARVQAPKGKVLALDDDPQILAALRSVLEPQGIDLITLQDPLAFWDTLEESAPDLVMLDIEMPHLSGIELCRMLRTDPRWNSTPVLFLTGHSDAATVQRVFAAGADDYVSKPFIGPELTTRIRNRLERTQIFRTLAETDTLTRVSSRRKSIQALQQFLKLSERHGRPFCMAVLDLDQFKQINDQYGHLAGDRVLQRFGQLLGQRFRTEDVVGRWGGDEFVIGMYGIPAEAARIRLNDLLVALRQEEFADDEGRPFRASFSAGLAEFPRSGRDLQSLYLAADRSLYRQKHHGRRRVGVDLSLAEEADAASDAME